EIAWRQGMADAMKKFTGHLSTNANNDQKRGEAYGVLSTLRNQSKQTIDAIIKGKMRLGNTGSVSSNRVREMAESLSSKTFNDVYKIRSESLRKLIQGPGLAGPSRLPLNALLDGDGIGPNMDADFRRDDLLNSADVILGVDVDSGREI